jgi:putative transposase
MRAMIEPDLARIAISRQCELIGLPRSTLYYEPAPETAENLLYMRLIDRQYTKTPFYGSRRMAIWLSGQGHDVNRKRVQRLMRMMGLEAIYPRPKTSVAAKAHRIYPYLLRGVEIVRPNQVWSTDITYIPMESGFMFLVAVLDWYSRYVLSWRISNTLDANFCLEALDAALRRGTPEVFNTDQGAQFTCSEFTGRLEEAGVKISMDGRGRALDNVFVERLWRTVKYEDIYLKNYRTGGALIDGMGSYFSFYNTERPHQALNYLTPASVYKGGMN